MRISEQVGEHLMQAFAIAGDGDDLLGKVETPVLLRRRGLCVGDRLEHQAGEVDRLAFEWTSGVQPCEEQEVVDQIGHPMRGGGDARQGGDRDTRACEGARVVDRLFSFGFCFGRISGVSTQGVLRVGSDGRQRRSQLVAGVGDEAPESSFGGVAFLQGGPDVLEHVTEGDAHLVDF